MNVEKVRKTRVSRLKVFVIIFRSVHVMADIVRVMADIVHVMADIVHVMADIVHVMADIVHVMADIVHVMADIIHVMADIVHVMADIVHVMADIVHVMADIVHVMANIATGNRMPLYHVQFFSLCHLRPIIRNYCSTILDFDICAFFWEDFTQRRTIAY